MNKFGQLSTSVKKPSRSVSVKAVEPKSETKPRPSLKINKIKAVTRLSSASMFDLPKDIS